jgi:hypothetical protein
MIRPAWAPSLLKFLSLCEKFPTTESPPHPGSIALDMLSRGPHDDFGAAHIPTLASMLSPDHRLQSRQLALTVFCQFSAGGSPHRWRMSQATTSIKLLQAVGDPFHFPPNPPHGELEEANI